mgnify:CR=1 FL=1
MNRVPQHTDLALDARDPPVSLLQRHLVFQVRLVPAGRPQTLVDLELELLQLVEAEALEDRLAATNGVSDIDFSLQFGKRQPPQPLLTDPYDIILIRHLRFVTNPVPGCAGRTFSCRQMRR